jgi:hypothetical protein
MNAAEQTKRKIDQLHHRAMMLNEWNEVFARLAPFTTVSQIQEQENLLSYTDLADDLAHPDSELSED